VEGTSNPELSKLLQRLRQKPFCIWDKPAHKTEWNRTPQGTCCFNHIIPAGLPIKNNIGHALYDYEKEILDALVTHKRIWVKKATGLGISELLLSIWFIYV